MVGDVIKQQGTERSRARSPLVLVSGVLAKGRRRLGARPRRAPQRGGGHAGAGPASVRCVRRAPQVAYGRVRRNSLEQPHGPRPLCSEGRPRFSHWQLNLIRRRGPGWCCNLHVPLTLLCCAAQTSRDSERPRSLPPGPLQGSRPPEPPPLACAELQSTQPPPRPPGCRRRRRCRGAQLAPLLRPHCHPEDALQSTRLRFGTKVVRPRKAAAPTGCPSKSRLRTWSRQRDRF
jgi:hypothetical protein